MFPTAGLPRNLQLPHGRLLEELTFLRLLFPYFCYYVAYNQYLDACHLARRRASYTSSVLIIRATFYLVHHQNLYSSAAVLALIVTTDYSPPIDN